MDIAFFSLNFTLTDTSDSLFFEKLYGQSHKFLSLLTFLSHTIFSLTFYLNYLTFLFTLLYVFGRNSRKTFIKLVRVGPTYEVCDALYKNSEECSLVLMTVT